MQSGDEELAGGSFSEIQEDSLEKGWSLKVYVYFEHDWLCCEKKVKDSRFNKKI